jgi:hypothetical protein
MSKVNNIAEFLKKRGLGETNMNLVKRNVYKYTNCGAFINWNDESIIINSIVEGVNSGTENYTLTFPFEINEFWNALGKVKKEAERIWNETHGCEDCGKENEMGYTSVNLECKTCNGEGIII